ncbi:DegT/DnrJ/EryC1/StrS aminotransferase family protein [Aeromonas encheleia]|uniref:DegT/DnrJ/EryC1/StrS family aminotransferase n=1 Tax=Aeromonas encheleia TaxID=73010 RepID=UPI001F57074E|nr:DegT/DnrJ/EryC1/StrS aminotransferase family protein [Aeromonas encheleia]UNP87318.1 DegT/DnrJ/EryC1/StrS aminotransferase family protein [Aeromonas encheleia]
MIPHNRPTLGHEESQAAARVLASGWIAQGEEVLALEHELGNFINLPAENVVAVSSGSAALYMSLMIANAKHRNVYSSAYSCRSIFNAIQLASGIPNFLDIEEVMANASFKKNADIYIVAHMFGIPDSNVENKQSYFLIEDAAQALGATIKNIQVGLFGDLGVFSLGATKIITSGGQGGIIISKNSNMSDLARKMRDYDSIIDAIPRFNFQMTDIQAAIAREQLKKLPDFIFRRAEIFKKYQSAGLPLIDNTGQDIKPVRFRAVILSDAKNIISCQESLLEKGIKSIVPVKEDELLTASEFVPNAVNLSNKTLSIPIYPSLSDNDVESIIDVCTKALKP